MAKTNIGVKIENEMKAKLEIIGKNNSISYADTVRIALVEYIQRHEKNFGKISPEEINQLLLFKKDNS